MRGSIKLITVDDAIKRAKSMIGFVPKLLENAPIDTKPQPIRYRLKGGYNGGQSPYAAHPASWSYGKRTPTCDCSGFIAWVLGYDRYQPHAGLGVKYLNTDNIILLAKSQKWFEILNKPELGCIIVYGKYDKNGKTYVGHIGLITSLPAEWDKDSNDSWKDLLVTHCSSGNDKKFGGAIQETSALNIWGSRIHRDHTYFIKYAKFN